jgi:hypothetical protein
VSGPGRLELRFIFDQHVSGPALRQLRRRGVDVIHVAEVGLASADDQEIFEWAREAGRIIVTRNHRDYAPLVEAYASRREASPGVLFYSSSVPEVDPGAHFEALESWIRSAQAARRNTAENTLVWLTGD